MATKERGRVMTGARTRLLIEGKTVGYATGLSIREELRTEELRVLGNIRAEENVDVSYRVSGDMSFARIVGQTLKSIGFFPKSGVTEEEHLSNILTGGQLSLSIEDVKTGKPIELVEEVKITGNNKQYRAEGMVTNDAQWVGIVARDESEI